MKSQSEMTREPAAVLGGPDKVTTLLLAMAKPSAQKIIKQFTDEQIRAVARAAMVLRPVDIETVVTLVEDLKMAIEAGSWSMAGSREEAEQLLAGVVDGQQLREFVEDGNDGSGDRLWAALSALPAEKLAGALAGEPEQIIAVVLSRLEVEKVSDMLALMPAGQRADVSERMLSVRPVSEGAIRLLENRLGQELAAAGAAGEGAEKLARIGAILNRLDKDKTSAIMTRLADRRPEDAKIIRRYLFSFEDIAKLGPEDRSRLFDEVSSDQVAVALNGSEGGLRDMILGSLSPRSRRIVEAELNGPMKTAAATVEAARRMLASTALELASQGKISLPEHEEGHPR